MLVMSYMTFREMHELAAIDRLLARPTLRVCGPVVGVQVMGGMAMLLTNQPNGSTVAWTHYDAEEPVLIRHRGVV
jgi:hypothetical protein